MRPSLGKYLSGATGTLGREIAPHLDTAYARAQIGAIGMVLGFVAREADRAAETLVNEQDALRALFASAAGAPLPDDLRTRLAAAESAARASLRISDLERENAALKALLIELHEAVEQSEACAGLEAQIWNILKDGAKARVISLGR